MKHQKHKKLSRPNIGNWARNEWAILGTNCGAIQALAEALSSGLQAHFKTAYVDASHGDETSEEKKAAFQYEFLGKEMAFDWTVNGEVNSFDQKLLLNEVDVALVNGNHYLAQKQIVVIDEKKKDSLHRKLDRLTDVSMILVEENEGEIFPFLLEHLATNSLNCTIYKKEEIAKITQHLLLELEQQGPPLMGLVLAGGKSSRMGSDKGLLDYHGKEQKTYLAELLNEFCEEVAISEKAAGSSDKSHSFESIQDVFFDLGPMGGILSAFQKNPNAAWLTIACDMPLVNRAAIDYLIQHRDRSKAATCFIKPGNDFPDPLFTIWEPKSYLKLLQFLSLGYACPRKVLINSDVAILSIPNPEWLENVNNKEEYEKVKDKICKR